MPRASFGKSSAQIRTVGIDRLVLGAGSGIVELSVCNTLHSSSGKPVAQLVAMLAPSLCANLKMTSGILGTKK